ncbi:beta-ketoacyl synthase chain length factor [Photobacterium chitinilyticum]|uniref:3-oxoacyl-ACP synthase n=1 Tax=Photobacterium chitinilyticum TaxID=2485123 RepID=A0A444JSY2_9GAMM|nr:beta-ketoacyl synthase chain length factor [Photobacterium chitinilyticum]RWX56159.1 3-oxoacyl-ACP synthase [Photobacterium chitinilyticum]
MNSISFKLNNWVALSPGLTDIDSWKTWAELEMTWPENPQAIPANLIPPMMRRRTSSLSKLALQTALTLTEGKDIDYIVFASRHGELTRSIPLIEKTLQGEDVSPTIFSQSVHNTAAGLFTIAAKRPVPAVSLASGPNTLHSALIEAAAYLGECPHHQVLVVDFDEPLPEPFRDFDHGQYQGYALGMLLTGGDEYQLQWEPHTNPVQPSVPNSLHVIRQLVSDATSWTIASGSQCWHWQRSGA